MEMNYEVRECRGAGIEYSVFQCSLAECEAWIKENCYEDVELMGDTHWVANDSSCINGDGFAWKYFVQVLIEN